MAIAGGATVAYNVRIHGGRVVRVPTTAVRDRCADVEDALVRIRAGEAVIVAGGDMAEFNRRILEPAQD